MPPVNKSAWELIQVASHYALSADSLNDIPVELPLVVLQWDSIASRDNIEGDSPSNVLGLSDRR